jgi:hypothetical protein
MAAVLLIGGASPGAIDDSGMLPEQCVPRAKKRHGALASDHRRLAERLRARRAATGCSELARAADTGDASAVREALADGAPPGADALQAAATGGHVLAVRELVKGAAIH